VLMDAGNVNNYRDLLESKSRDELNVIARHLRIVGFRKLSKDSLIEVILEVDTGSKTTKSFFPLGGINTIIMFMA
jgi:hypothetical protein